ncbi:hypothetical protein FQN53_006319 [Emmonsiellopsis sp. PD_33]|nr:hypothetical protein FQN53_006319 [Emmonsiellopsis sp. PD_33]
MASNVAAEVDDLGGQKDAKALVDYIQKHGGYKIGRRDQDILEAQNINGYTLVAGILKLEHYRDLGLTTGSCVALLRETDKYIEAKRSLKRSQLSSSAKSQPIQKRTHVQESSGSMVGSKDIAMSDVTYDQVPYERPTHDKEKTEDSTETSRSILQREQHVSLNVQFHQRTQPDLEHVSERCVLRRRQIVELFTTKYESLDDAKAKLSDPKHSTDLPFPYLGLGIPRRFSIRGEKKENYHYTGREVFSEVVDAFDTTVGDPSLIDLWVYGPIGYGKSHLLATLTCYLTAQGMRVIYLPDCRVLLRQPARYLTVALLFAWADMPEKVEQILKLRKMADIEAFIQQNWSPSVTFVIDQMNGLEGEDDARQKTQVRYWLEGCRCAVKSVLSTSANNVSFHKTIHRQSNDYLLKVLGGFTRAEMDAWWLDHKDIVLGGYTEEEIEDYTGCNPLLLTNCTAGNKVNFDCEEFNQVVRRCQRFVLRMKSTLGEWNWLRYQDYVKACFTGQITPKDVPSDNVDHRFFFEENEQGRCLCGIVREAVTKELALLGTYLFSIDDCTAAMGQLITNPVVVGFFLEQAMILSICQSGIRHLNISGRMPQISFEQFPTYDLTKTTALYVPKAFNFPAIDALVLHIDKSKKKARMVPIQITIQQAHKDPRDLFFNHFKKYWCRNLEKYEVTVEFLLLGADDIYEGKDVEEKYLNTRSGGDTLVYPDHRMIALPIKSVNETVWRRYEEAKSQHETKTVSN